MGWIQSLFRPRQDYEPLQNGTERDDDSAEDEVEGGTTETPFSWLEYAIFFLLGIAMLWAWYVSQSSIVGEVINIWTGTCFLPQPPTSSTVFAQANGL